METDDVLIVATAFLVAVIVIRLLVALRRRSFQGSIGEAIVFWTLKWTGISAILLSPWDQLDGQPAHVWLSTSVGLSVTVTAVAAKWLVWIFDRRAPEGIDPDVKPSARSAMHWALALGLLLLTTGVVAALWGPR